MAQHFARTTPPVDMINARHAWRAGEGFEVISRDGVTRYEVAVEGGIPLCSCRAAHFGLPCFHAAVVLRRLMRASGINDHVASPERLADAKAEYERRYGKDREIKQ